MLYLQYGFFFLALLTRISVETADTVSKAYNKSQKDLTADSVHAPRTSCAACWKARLLEGSIYDVLTLVLKMSKQVLWCVVAEFHTISVKPWTFHHSKHNTPKTKTNRHRKYQLLAHIYGRALWWFVWCDGRNLSRWFTFSYIVYTAQDVFGLPSVFWFVSSNVRVTKKCILYLTHCKYNFPLIFSRQK